MVRSWTTKQTESEGFVTEAWRPCYEDDDEAETVSRAGGFFIAQCRSRIANTFPVATPAIPQQPQWTHSHSPVSHSETL